VTGGESWDRSSIFNEFVDAAIISYLNDPTVPATLILNDRCLDIAAAVNSASLAQAIVADSEIGWEAKRDAVRAAILLANRQCASLGSGTINGDSHVSDAEFAARCRRTIELYMDAFNRRDMVALQAVLDEHASLVDWEVSASGRNAMIAATEAIVGGAKLHITVRRVLMDSPLAVADLVIRINDQINLEVLDLFEFTPEGLIKSVRAFKGPESKQT
jgi:hypothetical protein